MVRMTFRHGSDIPFSYQIYFSSHIRRELRVLRRHALRCSPGLRTGDADAYFEDAAYREAIRILQNAEMVDAVDEVGLIDAVDEV